MTRKNCPTSSNPYTPPYLNSLNLKSPEGKPLTLDAQGNGSFKNHIAGLIAKSAQAQLDAGKDLSDRTWLTVRKGKVVSVDFDAYAKAARPPKNTTGL